jgi:hypothetical protein
MNPESQKSFYLHQLLVKMKTVTSKIKSNYGILIYGILIYGSITGCEPNQAKPDHSKFEEEINYEKENMQFYR